MTTTAADGHLRGRPKGRDCKAEVIGELTPADLLRLGKERPKPKGYRTFNLQKLKDSHHHIAKMIVQGFNREEISAETGYSREMISTLKSQPIFIELLEHYRDHHQKIEDDAYAAAMGKLAAVRNDTIEELHDRVLARPELISVDQIIEIIKTAADRTGLGPASKSTNLNVNVDIAERVAAGRQRLERLYAENSATPGILDLSAVPGKQSELTDEQIARAAIKGVSWADD